ncbi:hypothetical protein F4553_006326 [Allocatelliglobosispora scoriae]|uniref:Aminoglycoside phosphotransferase domain-containing protein n=1 Tax=Allocatelliglobosispora scoriae TaxID=643052 RepID=A0A841C1F1_9ACTN|nr:phosphotransferase [Allocatelliglobosispora scoriae]MBB5872892.1 hypothetical protein [Allocatelliglobosispora scoriae]
MSESHLAHLDAIGVITERTIRDSDKSYVVSGTFRGRAVVAKVLTSEDPHWIERQAWERGLYASLGEHPPPVRLPKLLHETDRCLVLERLPGTVLAPGRYPSGLDPIGVWRVLDALAQLHSWSAGTALGPAELPTASLIDRQAASGQLRPRDRELVEQLLDGATAVRPEHGDPLASNILISPGSVGLIDLEHTGLRLPGVDWAVIRLLWAPGNPWVAPLIEDRVRQEGIDRSYAVHLMLLACREWRVHLRDGRVPESMRSTLTANINLARRAVSLA